MASQYKKGQVIVGKVVNVPIEASQHEEEELQGKEHYAKKEVNNTKAEDGIPRYAPFPPIDFKLNFDNFDNQSKPEPEHPSTLTPSGAPSVTFDTSKQEAVFECMKSQKPTLLDLVIVTESSANLHNALFLDWIPSMAQMFRKPAAIGGVKVSFLYYDLEPDPELTSEMMHNESGADNKGQTNANKEYELLIKEKYPFIEYRKFNYSNYPEHYHITKFSLYAWKPAIFKEVVLQHRKSLVYWLDAGLLLKKPIFVDDAFTHLRHQGIHTPVSLGNLKKWTHRGTVQYLGLNESIYEDPSTSISAANNGNGRQ